MTFEFLSGLWIVKVDVSKPYRAKVECVWLIGIGLSPGHGICKVGDWSRLSLISICDSIILSVWCFGGGFDNWLRFCWRWVQQLVEIIYRLYQKIVTGLKFELSVTTKLPTCLLSKTPLPSFEFRRKLAIWWNIYQDIISRINEKWGDITISIFYVSHTFFVWLFEAVQCEWFKAPICNLLQMLWINLQYWLESGEFF